MMHRGHGVAAMTLSAVALSGLAAGEERVPAVATQASSPPRTLASADLKELAWRSVGPANMGGRVADVCFAPGDSKCFFVGFATGGLWKTTNRGTTLAPVFDNEVTSSIGAVAVVDAPPSWAGWSVENAGAPQSSPASGPAGSQPLAEDRGRGKIVWVGTGEGNGRNSSSWGHGVYRSTDGGGSFTHLGLEATHEIPAIAVDPRDPDVCYVAALGRLWGPNPERGVYKTIDGGKTWRAALHVDAETGACDVIVDPLNPDVVYAAMYSRLRTPWSFRSGGPQGGIYRSTDAGEHWTKLTRGLPPQTGRIGLDVFRANPRVLYAIVESDFGGAGVEPFDDRQRSGGLFRSEDGGDSWTRVNDYNPRPFYFSKVRVDPHDDQRVYLLGWVLYVSDDGGRTLRAGGARTPHVDLHALDIDLADSDHLLLGTDGGIYQSFDRGATWDFLNHIAVGQFYNVACDLSEPYRIGGGLQDNGTWIGPSETLLSSGGHDPAGETGITNADWRLVGWGDGFHMAFDPHDSNIVYAEWQGGELNRVHLDTGRVRHIQPGPKEGQPRHRFNWNSPFLVSAHAEGVLYLGGNALFRLTERGDQWQRISPDLTTNNVDRVQTVGSEAETHCTIVSLAESSRERGLLWTGSDDGLVHVTRDDGASWTNVTPPEAGGRYVSRIEASHHDLNTAYVALDGHRTNEFAPHLWMTTDGGISWVSLVGVGSDAPLPADDIVKVVREDVRNPSVLYVGMERGLYVSVDRGRRWVRMNGDSLPTVPIDDIRQHPRELDLIVGTHGRSIYILDDAGPLGELTDAVMSSELHLFETPPARPKFFLEYAGLWTDRLFRAKNPPSGAVLTYWLRERSDESVSISIADAGGRTIRSLSGGGQTGINRVAWDLMCEEHDRITTPDGWTPPQVSPGEYTVTVSVGTMSARGKVVVAGAPGTDGARSISVSPTRSTP